MKRRKSVTDNWTGAEFRLARFEQLLQDLIDQFFPIDHPAAAFWNGVHARIVRNKKRKGDMKSC